MKRPTSPEDVQKVFDCYCKKILKNEAINIQKHNQRMNDLQISFSELTPEQLAELSMSSRKIKFPSPAQRQRIIIAVS